MTRTQQACLVFGAAYIGLLLAAAGVWRQHAPVAVYIALAVLLLGFIATGTAEMVRYWRRPR